MLRNMLAPEERIKILLEAPPNSWIALSEDESRIVATASTYEEIVAMAEREGVDDPLLIRIPDEWPPTV